MTWIWAWTLASATCPWPVHHQPSPKKYPLMEDTRVYSRVYRNMPRATQTPSQRCAGEVLTTGLQETGTWINGINGISGINGGNTWSPTWIIQRLKSWTHPQLKVGQQVSNAFLAKIATPTGMQINGILTKESMLERRLARRIIWQLWSKVMISWFVHGLEASLAVANLLGQLKFWRHWILLRRCRSFVIFTKLRQNLLVLGVSALWEKQLIGRRAPAVWWKVSRRLSVGQCTNPKWRMAYSTASCQCLGVCLTMASWSIWTCSKARIQGWAVGPGALWRIHAPYHQSRLLLYTLDLGLLIRSYYLILFDLESIWSSTTVVLTHRCQTLLRTTTTWSWRTLGAQSSWNRWSGFSLSLKLTVSKSCVKSWCPWPTFTTQWEFAIVISSSPHGFTRARESPSEVSPLLRTQ